MTLVDGKYSDKYRFLDQQKLSERNQRTVVARERAKLLSQATNKRRRAIEEKRSKEERQEEERREAILSQRREWQNQATIRFQRAHLPPEKRNFKYSRIRPRTPPRSISVEDALRTIQTQKFDRSSSFPRQNSKSPDAFQGSSLLSKDQNNNSSPYAQQQYIPGFHHYIRSASQYSIRGNNGHNNSSPYSYGEESPADFRDRQLRAGTGQDVKLSNSFNSGTSSVVNMANGAARSSSAGAYSTPQTPLARDKLRIVTETYNIQPYQPHLKNKRPESAAVTSAAAVSNSSNTTTTIVQLDNSSTHKTQTANSTFLQQKIFAQHQPQPQHSAKHSNGTNQESDREKFTRETYQMNSAATPKSTKPPVVIPRASPQQGITNGNNGREGLASSSQINAQSSKSAFEKQLELQQKKLVEMQQKTVEEFQRALSNSAAMTVDMNKNGSGTTATSSDSKIVKDSLDGDSDSSEDEKVPTQKRKTIQERPMNPAPHDDEKPGTDSNGKTPQNGKPATPNGSKFRTPQSTVTISAEQAKTLMSPGSNIEENFTENNDPGNYATMSEQGKNGSEKEPINKSIIIHKQTASTQQIKRKPLPINSANTVAKANEVKSTSSDENEVSNNLASQQLAHTVAPVKSENSNVSAHVTGKPLKQEPGPTVHANNNVAQAKTPLQYIAYTPIRKWDSPGSMSPKPIAEVAPVPSTPPSSDVPNDSKSAPQMSVQDNNITSKLVGDQQMLDSNLSQPLSSKSEQNLTTKDLKHSAKMYMNGLSQNAVIPPQPVATVAHVIDPQWSIYNNSQKSLSSNETSSTSNAEKMYEPVGIPLELNENSSNGYHYIVSANPGMMPSPGYDPKTTADDSDDNTPQPPLQKSLIPVPISKDKDSNSGSKSITEHVENVQKHQTSKNSIHHQPDIANNSTSSVTGKPPKGSNVRQDSDASVGSQKSRPEIRSSSPFDRLLDGSNPDEIEELEALEEQLVRPKSILKRSPSLESCPINVKDSLDIQSNKRLAKTPTPVSEKRAASAKRSVRFAETVQVQSKDEIDERLPRSHARAMSARGTRSVAESPDRSRKAAGSKSAPLKPPASQNVPAEIEDIRNAQAQHKSAINSDSDNEYHLNKTPTDEEINALWESVRENMSANKRQAPAPMYDNLSNQHKPPVYISNNSVGYYNNFIKPTSSPPAVASQYIDGSFLFAEQGNQQASNGQIARPGSAASIPRKQQHLLGQRQQQTTVRPISGNQSSSAGSRGAGSNPAQNPPNTPIGNHAPFPGVPKASSGPMFSPSTSASPSVQKTQQQQQFSKQQQPPDTVSNSLAQFLAAEDLSNMAASLSEDQIEDILGQLQARRRQSPATQLSLEEQKLLMSLEHLNNKLKLTEARFKGQ